MENDEIYISRVDIHDLEAIARLEQRVTEAFVYPTLSPEGQMALRESQIFYLQDILNTHLYESLKACDGDRLVGFAAIRNGDYLAKLFVDSDYQGKGIGKLLLDTICKSHAGQIIQLRASLNAVGFYEHYGFTATGPEDEVNDIRFLPMAYMIAGDDGQMTSLAS